MRGRIEAHMGGDVRRRLIATKTGRSGSRDTARRVEPIIWRTEGAGWKAKR
jgi:hypothetical protein